MTPPSGRAWLDSTSITPDQWRRQWQAAALALGEELSGIRIDRHWLTQPHLCLFVGSTPPVATRESEDFQVEEWMVPWIQKDERLRNLASDPIAGGEHAIIGYAVDIALRYVQAEDPLEQQAIDLIARQVRDATTERVRAGLRPLRDHLHQKCESIEQTWPDPAHDYYAFLEHTQDSHYRSKASRVTLLDILSLALDPDLGTAAHSAPDRLNGLPLSIEDQFTARLLNRLGHYLAYGTNA